MSKIGRRKHWSRRHHIKPALQEKWVEVNHKSRAGVKYIKYKRILVPYNEKGD